MIFGRTIRRTFDFMLRHWKIVLPILLVLAASGGYAAWRTLEYMNHDPTFCTNCHAMNQPFELWQKSAHKEVDCHTCHPSDMQTNLRHLYMATIEGAEKPSRQAEVPPDICGGCHNSGDSEQWVQIAETEGHKLHFFDKKIECIVCHAPSVHEFLPNDEMCKQCHPDRMVAFPGMKDNHCTSCHNFMARDRGEILPSNDECARCHATKLGDAPVMVTGWHPGAECKDCHNVHDRSPEMLGGIPDRDGYAKKCENCHRNQVEPVSHEGECRSCHPPHTPFNPKSQCGGCHEDRLQAVERPESHRSCGDCHRPHEPGLSTLDTCIDCHDDKVEDLTEAAPVGHDACERCHAPHESATNKPLDCATCHVQQAKMEKQHEKCSDCHNPHRAKELPSCTDGGCHVKERPMLTLDHKACTDCHQPHQPVSKAAASCTGCHKGELAKPVFKGHDQCGGCHKPHQPTFAKPTEGCRECHEKVTMAVVLEPEKHQVCADCHPAHQPWATRTKQCADCHKDQKASLRDQPKGHQDCKSCHPRHAVRGSMTCVSCHEEQQAAVKKFKEPKHQDCQGCHGGVHKPDPPAPKTNALCVTCHKTEKTQGLHATKKHDDCLGCHGAHGPTLPGEKICSDCHPAAEIKNHPDFPPGPVDCKGCHNFLGDSPPKKKLP